MSDSFFGPYPQGTEGLPMHTDEYEISLGREIKLCRKRVKHCKKALERREKQCGMTTAAFLQALEAGGLSEQPALLGWRQEYQELQYWQKLLSEYEAALESLKWL
jgi:hypothetical protein